MTKQEMLASVEAQIRKEIPRLMELREGCWVNLTDDFGKTLWSVKVLSNANGGISYLNGGLTRIEYRNKKFFEIIGHDIMLNDVLEWLFVHNLISYCISSTGEFFYWLTAETPETQCGVCWDFSKPYLKDQSEELINFLYNIINE